MDSKEIYWGKELEALLPLEKQQAIGLKGKSVSIGLAKEDGENEMRVALTPALVSVLVASGFSVNVEKEAGKEAHFSDESYAKVGAKICETAKEVFSSDILFKVSAPTLNELSLLKDKACLFSTLDICKQPKEYYRILSEKKITALSYELVKDKTGGYPLLKAISEIVGQRLPFIATQCLSNEKYGKRIMLGSVAGIIPTKVVIVGAGTVASYAVRYLIHLGCDIKIFDDSIRCLRRLEDFTGRSLATSMLYSNRFKECIKEADVIIFAKYSKEATSAWIITEEMVQQMSEGSVIIDVSIDQGGGVETSEATTLKKPIFVKHGVIHHCVPNIASSIPKTSSEVISNFLHPFFEFPSLFADIKTLLLAHTGLRSGTYVYQGILTNSVIGQRHGISSQDIHLLLNSQLG